MRAVQSGTQESRSVALKSLCELTAADDPHLEILHRLHVVGVLQKILTGPHAQDQYDALWCLTNLATADHDATCLVYPALPYVINILSSDNIDLAEQAAWCLGNIAGDCDVCRARVARNGAVDPLLELYKRPKLSPTVVATLSFSTCNLLRGGTFVEEFVSKGLISLVLRLMTPAYPVEVVTDMAWVLSFITAASNEIKGKVVATGAVELIVQLLDRAGANSLLIVPLLRVVGNLASGPDQLVMAIVSTQNFLPYLWNYLSSGDNNVLKEVCWALGSLSGGPPQASAALVQSKFVPPLAALFNGSVMAVRKEVGFVFLNMVSALRDSTPILEMLVAMPGVVSGYVECINLPDIEMVEMGVRWASIMLKYHPMGKEIFEENMGLTALEDLEYNPHKNEKLFSKANRLLDEYFTDDVDMEDAQQDSRAREFAFAGQVPTGGPGGFNF